MDQVLNKDQRIASQNVSLLGKIKQDKVFNTEQKIGSQTVSLMDMYGHGRELPVAQDNSTGWFGESM